MKKCGVHLAKVEYQALAQFLVRSSTVAAPKQRRHSSGLLAEQVLHLLLGVQTVVQASELVIGAVGVLKER